MKNTLTENLTVKFINAEVTNTRLMGALGLYVHWDVSDSTGESLRLRQFIRFDVDLNCIEFLAFARDDDHQKVGDLIQEYFGALGGSMVKLSERQCLYLGNYFIESTMNSGRDIPDDIAQVDFFSDKAVTLTEEEKRELMNKICVPIKGDFGVINYFLMRAFAKDQEAQKYLFSENALPGDCNDISFPMAGELIRNNIEPFDRTFSIENPDGPVVTYLCESTVAVGRENYLVLSEIHVDSLNGKVMSVEKTHSQKMSIFESAVVINRPEYIACFDMISNDKAIKRLITKLSGSAMVFEHEAGNLYMVMNSDNDHVEKQTFRISDDVKVIFFITNAEQLLAVSSKDLVSAGVYEVLAPFIAADNIMEFGNYQMETPVFYDFIDSEYDDFEEFLEDMQLE